MIKQNFWLFVLACFISDVSFSQSKHHQISQNYRPIPHVYRPTALFHAYHPVPHIYRPAQEISHHVRPPVKPPVRVKSSIVYQPTPHIYRPVTWFKKNIWRGVQHKAQRLQMPERKTTAILSPVDLYRFGPYVGASLGLRLNGTGAPANYYGGEGTLALGYGHLWDRFYLAAELIGGESTTFKNLPNGLSNVISGWSLGGDLIPGFLLNDDILGYLRVGGVSTQFNAADMRQGAWQVGLGGQTHLSTHIDLRGEYVFSAYQKIPDMGTPRASQFNVGLLYRFV